MLRALVDVAMSAVEAAEAAEFVVCTASYIFRHKGAGLEA